MASERTYATIVVSSRVGQIARRRASPCRAFRRESPARCPRRCARPATRMTRARAAASRAATPTARRRRRSRRDTIRTAACTVPRLLRPGRRVVRMRIDVRDDVPSLIRAQPIRPRRAIGVPATPTDTIRYISAGDTPCIASSVPIAGGAGFIPRDAGPSPRPSDPWHDAQLRS